MTDDDRDAIRQLAAQIGLLNVNLAAHLAMCQERHNNLDPLVAAHSKQLGLIQEWRANLMGRFWGVAFGLGGIGAVIGGVATAIVLRWIGLVP